MLKTRNQQPAPWSTGLPLWLQMLCLVIAGGMVYGHTLDVPFYLDDYSSIVDNPVIYDRENWLELWEYAGVRIVGYLTFAANFHFNHFQPAGYHLVNILIHILTGMVFLSLVRGLLRTPAIKRCSAPEIKTFLPLFIALLFVVHPLQTQAVTYVVQRLASLAALWYLAAMASYVSGRIAATGVQRFGFFFLALLCSILAGLTKQNTVTLPLLLWLVELIFFPASRKIVLALSAVLGALGGLLWWILAYWVGIDALSLASLDAASRETAAISRSAYFFTQMHVLWIYIKMFFLPIGLHLEHDIALVSELTNWPTVAALTGHLVILIGALLAIRRFPLPAFAILFYYGTHSVESSLIPIRDLLFEHRTYLPNAGLCLFSGWLIFALPTRWLGGALRGIIVLAVLLGAGVLTWQRNQVWRDPVALWHDAALHAPQVARPWNEYAKHLLDQGKNKQAIAVFLSTLERTGGNTRSPGLDLEESAAINLVMALAMDGKSALALEIAEDYLTRDIPPLQRSKMLTNRGNIYYQQHNFAAAEDTYRQAIAVFGKNIMPLFNLSYLLVEQKRFDEAAQFLGRSLEIEPKFAEAQELLQMIDQRRAAPAQTGR